MANGLDVVRDCNEMLTNADSDVEKIAALLFAAQHIRSDECDARSKAELFRSVGADFLSRMLSGKLSLPDSEDCSSQAYASTALAIITGFCVDPEVARSNEMLQLVPHILVVLEKYDLSLMEESLQYLRCIIQHPEGRRSLLSHGALKRFANVYSRTKSDEIVAISLILTQTPGVDDVWDRNEDTFNSLMTAIALEFEKNHSEKKFKLCSALRCLIYSYTKLKVPDNKGSNILEWHKSVFRGLRDILTSRIDDEQRDPALKLAAMMVDHNGFYWSDSRLDHDGNRKFQFLLVHLSSIEVRMQLEDQPLDQILKNADLVTSCFTILEIAIAQFHPGQTSDTWIKNQISLSFIAAGTAVEATIKSIIGNPSLMKNTSEEKFFIYALVRFLSLGFTYEVLTSSASVYEIMPFVVKVATDSFYSYKIWFEENGKPGTKAQVPVIGSQPVNFLAVLMPALRYFATEDKGMKIILGMMGTFLDSLAFHWKAVEYILSQTDESTNGGDPNKKHENFPEARNSMIFIFEVLTDTIIIHPKAAKNSKFASVFNFILEKLPYLDYNERKLLPIHITSSILGLLLIKYRKQQAPENDPNVLLIVKSSIVFLKANFESIQTVDQKALASNLNPKLWVNMKELWYLGMDILRKLITMLPWLKPVIETEMGPEILDYLTTESAY